MKQKKEPYIEKTGLLGDGVDYHVYHMKPLDYIIGFLIGFLIFLLVICVFFESIPVGIIGGALCGIVTIRFYNTYMIKKRKRTLLLQFKDLLESLSASYSAGRNTLGAFQDAYKDMLVLFGEEAFISKELELLILGLSNNIIIEDLLTNLAERSELDDIASFAGIFESGNRMGSNIKDIVSQTRDIINDKIEIEMEIETMVTGNKSELYIMTIMPVVIVFALKWLGEESITAMTMTNILTRIAALILIVIAFLLGKKIVDIKI